MPTAWARWSPPATPPAPTASARYDAFGQTLAKTGSISRYGYAGREPDQTGLIYYRARTYDPGLGRFGQRDPAGFADGINPYAYVGNNPISFSDPLGLSKQAPRVVAGSSFAGVSKIGWGGAAQFGLDVLATSEIPVVSQVAGLIGAGVYASQGDKFGTASSLAGLIPVAGIIGDGARMGRWAGNAVDGAADFARVTKGVDPNTLLRTHSIEGKNSSKLVDELSDSMRQGGFIGDAIDVVEHNGQRYIIDGHHRAAAARRQEPKLILMLSTI